MQHVAFSHPAVRVLHGCIINKKKSWECSFSASPRENDVIFREEARIGSLGLKFYWLWSDSPNCCLFSRSGSVFQSLFEYMTYVFEIRGVYEKIVDHKPLFCFELRHQKGLQRWGDLLTSSFSEVTLENKNGHIGSVSLAVCPAKRMFYPSPKMSHCNIW